MRFLRLHYPVLLSSGLLVLGCGAMQQPSLNPNLAHPARNSTTTPRVEFVGDDISIGLVAYAKYQMWSCTDCASGATSGQLLAALPLTIAKKPDLVHILAGSYDVDDPNWISGACNGDSPDLSRRTCANVQAMMAQLKAAGIPYVVGNVPEWQDGTLSNQLAQPAGGVLFVQSTIFFYDDHLGDALGNGPETAIPIIDYADALPAADISGNGIDPNAQGYAAMLTLAQAAIDQMHVGELR